jgi:hypothetical protein
VSIRSQRVVSEVKRLYPMGNDSPDTVIALRNAFRAGAAFAAQEIEREIEAVSLDGLAMHANTARAVTRYFARIARDEP